MEILAPAGSYESLIAAVRCGADAVYLGGKALNARRSAANFDDDELRRAVSYCRERNVKVYLTLNTLVFDEELESAQNVIETACSLGIDALIVQDLSIASIARKTCPTLELHASTQMSVHNLEGVKQLKTLGFSRAVLAREMSAEEIAAVSGVLDLEVFVHGALCASVSGQCLLSSVIGGRSGNRGMCAQPCRLPFKDGSYPLSLKDLSLISRVDELKKLGVRSLKIEGRMKRPEYVAAAVTALRRAINGEQPDYRALESVFSRSGFTDGYFADRRDASMFGTRGKDDVTAAEPVLKKLANLYKDERQSIPLDALLTLRLGEPSKLTLSGVTATGSILQLAQTAPTTLEKAETAISKMGGTPYFLNSFAAEIEPDVMLPSSELNALRRNSLEQLSTLRSAAKPHSFTRTEIPRNSHKHTILKIRARVSSREQLTCGADEFVVPLEEWDGVGFLEIPSIVFPTDMPKLRKLLENAKNRGATDALVGNLGGLRLAEEFGFTPHGGHALNITNGYAPESLGLADAELSVELSAERIKKIGGGALGYGYLPIMALRNFHSETQLIDRKGNQFRLESHWGVTYLYNCAPLYIGDKQRDFPNADFFTLYFTNETPKQCAEIVERFRRGEALGGEKTRGLYFREVY
ncbi:hypothetical protein FACS1894202_02940 [Clostridia bacterium]|nr:hypothetical protein FACS1894202_02940 [Clostridia bacterium]